MTINISSLTAVWKTTEQTLYLGGNTGNFFSLLNELHVSVGRDWYYFSFEEAQRSTDLIL